MASDLLTLPQASALIETGTPNDILDGFIDDADAAIKREYGPHSGARTETLHPVGGRLWLSVPATTVASVAEYGANELAVNAKKVASATYELRFGGRALSRVDREFEANVIVVYTPQDTTAIRKAMLIDLVRLADQYEGVSISTVGPVTTHYLDYHRERRAILGRLRSMRPRSAFA